jgi:hypothetical protein
MEISKKQLVFYTIFLLTLASGVTMVLAPQPADIPTLWDRLWKVEEPVEVEGTVSLATGTTLIPGKIYLVEDVVIPDGEGMLIPYGTPWAPIDVDGYKRVYMVVKYTNAEPVKVTASWWYESEGPGNYYIELGETGAGLYDYQAVYELDVSGKRFSAHIQNIPSSGTPGASTTVDVYLYISPV